MKFEKGLTVLFARGETLKLNICEIYEWERMCRPVSSVFLLQHLLYTFERNELG